LKVRDRVERINIETELAAEGLSNRAIADVLGCPRGQLEMMWLRKIARHQLPHKRVATAAVRKITQPTSSKRAIY
jgi:hypothetical protein